MKRSKGNELLRFLLPGQMNKGKMNTFQLHALGKIQYAPRPLPAEQMMNCLRQQTPQMHTWRPLN